MHRLLAIGGRGLSLSYGLSLKRRSGGIQISRIDIAHDGLDLWRTRLQSMIHRNLQIVVYLLLQPVDAFFIENALADKEHLHACYGIACGIVLALHIGAIGSLIIRKRMRVRPDDVGVNKSRPAAGAAMGYSPGERPITDGQVGAIN